MSVPNQPGHSTDSSPNVASAAQSASQSDQNPMDMQTNGHRPNDKYKLKCTSIRKLIKEMIFHNGALDMKLNENCKEIIKLKAQREYLCTRLIEYEKFDLDALRGEQPENKQTKKLKKSIDEIKNKTKKTKVKCNQKDDDNTTELKHESEGDPRIGESNEDSAGDLKKVKSRCLKADRNLMNKARASAKSAIKNGPTKVSPKNSQPSQPAASLSGDKMNEITRIVKLPANDVITTSLPPSSNPSTTTITTSILNCPASLRSSSLFLSSNVPNCNTSSIISAPTKSSSANSSIGSLPIGNASLPSADLQSGGHLQISLQKGNLTGSKILSGNGLLSGVNKIQVSSLANSKLITGNVLEVAANKLIATASVNKTHHPHPSNHHEPIISNLLTPTPSNSHSSNLSSCANLLPNGGIVTINSHSLAQMNSSASGNLLKSPPSNHSTSSNLLGNSNSILNKSDLRIIINNQPLGGQSFVIRPVNLNDKSLFANKIISVTNGTGAVESGNLTGDQLPNEGLKLSNKTMTVLNNSPFYYLNQNSDLVQDYVDESKAGLISLNELDNKNSKALSFGLIV